MIYNDEGQENKEIISWAQSGDKANFHKSVA